MYIPLLIIGTSPDGIGNTPYLPSSLEDAREFFGYYISERKVIGAQNTSTTLTYDVWGDRYSIYQNQAGIIVQEPLYSPGVSGTTSSNTNIITFGCPGASGEYYFKYARNPYEDDLILALENVLAQNLGNFPYLLRVEGNKANTTIGTLYLEAGYSGELYNSLSVSVTGASLTITYPSLYRQSPFFTYSTSNIGSMVSEINADYSYGLHPITASFVLTSTSLPSGSYTLTGGTSSSLSASGIVEILSLLDLDEVGLILLAGGQPQDVISAALDYIEDNTTSPTCLIVGDPVGLKSSYTTSQYETFLNNLTYSSNRLFYVPGWGVLGPDLKWVSLSSVFAGLWSKTSSSPTHKAAQLQDLFPNWSADQLASLGQSYDVFTRFIQTGLSPYRSCPTDGSNPLVTKVKLDIAQRIVGSLEQYIGDPSIDVSTVTTVVGNALDGLDNVGDLKYSCQIDLYTITVTISVLVYGEVRYITLSLSTKRPIST